MRLGVAATDDDEPACYVIHLSVRVDDLDAAKQYARDLCATLAERPELDAGLTTVSHENGQHVSHRVFCDRLLPDRQSRCRLAAGHSGACDALHHQP